MGRKRKSTEFYDVSATSVHTSHVGDVLMQDAMTPEDDNCFGANTRRQQQVNGTSTTGSGSSANARERARMRVLSRAFVRLKTTLPWVPVDTKLSKLDTLRLATCYIAHLRHVLADDADSATDNDVTTVTANTSDDSKTSSSPPATFPVNLVSKCHYIF